jgi:hypothetical protein
VAEGGEAGIFSTMRIAAETVVGILLTLLMAVLFVGLGLLLVGRSASPVSAFLNDAPRLTFGIFWIGIALWLLLVLLGGWLHRDRTAGARVLHDLVSAAVAAVLGVTALHVLTFGDFLGGALGSLLFAVVLPVATAFVAAAAIMIPLTHFVLFRPRVPAAT